MGTCLMQLAADKPAPMQLLNLDTSPWGRNPTRSLRPGEVLGVTVHTTSEGGALWWLAPESVSGTRKPLEASTREAVDRAGRMAVRALPVHPATHRTPTLEAYLLCRQGEQPVHHVKGSSFGLSAVLAHASLLTGIPMDSNWAASATVDENGNLGPVRGIATKARLLADQAVGVEVFLVHPKQVEEARQATEGRRALEVRGVGDLPAALQCVLPDLERQLADAWRLDPKAAERAAREEFRQALFGNARLFDWSGIARHAEVLANLLSPDSLPHRQARVAHAIATRHQSNGGGLDPDEALELPLPLQLRYQAHVVQAAADSGDPEAARECAKWGRHFIPGPGSRLTAHLVLAGAVGRAIAASGDEAEAADWLEPVVQDWLDGMQEAEASYALCELIRLRGVLGDATALEELLEPLARVQAAPDTSEISRGFQWVALGRAWVQAQQPERGLEAFRRDDVEWNWVPDHLQDARHRWMRRAQLMLQHPVDERADDPRERDAAQELLIEIDRVRHVSADPSEVLERVAAMAEYEREIRRTWSLAQGDLAYLADHVRY